MGEASPKLTKFHARILRHKFESFKIISNKPNVMHFKHINITNGGHTVLFPKTSASSVIIKSTYKIYDHILSFISNLFREKTKIASFIDATGSV